MNGKPLIYYTIDVARQLTSDENICVSSDDEEIIQAVEDYGLKVPFKRPDHLATDTATTNDVLLHALNFYQSKGINYEVIILLQPTSPLRTVQHVREAMDLYDNKIDMVVSVKKSHAASVLCSENDNGYLEFCFNKLASRRQDVTSYYEYNGAIYIINIERLKSVGLSGFRLKKKYVMDAIYSVDIDSEFDWKLAEIIEKKIEKIF